jgi:ribonuclease Z
VFCVGYVLQEDDSTGKLNLEKLKLLGVKPGPIYGQLKSGKDVTLDDGTIVS